MMGLAHHFLYRSIPCEAKEIIPELPAAFQALERRIFYHLFSTFSAKPGKSFTSMTCPPSSTALPVKRPNTWCWSDLMSFISVQEARSSTGTKSISKRPSSEVKVQGDIKSFRLPEY